MNVDGMIYISGKITGTDDYVERFKAAEIKLTEMGWGLVINPVEITKDIPGGSPWTLFMRRCLVRLPVCDAIYMLKGWEDSKGAVLERHIAMSLGMKVIEEG